MGEFKYQAEQASYGGTLSEKMQANHRISDITGYQVALLSDVGKMCMLWMPNRPEGRYTFEGNNTGKVADYIYFEAQNGEWMIRCLQPARFRLMDCQFSQAQKLIDHYLYVVELEGDKYILYTEATNKNSSIFHNYFVSRDSDIAIGRAQFNDIIYPNQRVSQFHAVIRWEQNVWKVTDQQSSNGTFANGRSITSKTLNIGDSVYILGLQIVLGIGFISINDGNERVYINSGKLCHIRPNQSGIGYNVIDKSDTAVKLFNRFPRKREAICREPISIEAPPVSLDSNNIPLLLRMGSPLVMSSASLLAGNITSMLSSVLFPVITQKYTDKQKKEYEARRTTKYTAYLAKKADEIQKELRREEQILNFNYPELAQMLAFPDSEKRLWERRKTDDDFASLRLGYGQLPMIAEFDYPQRSFEIDDDELMERMYQLAEAPKRIKKVPIMSSFVEAYVCGVLGNRKTELQFIIGMIAQLVILHSYDEMKIILLANTDEINYLRFIRYLPHLWTDQKDFRFLATNNHEASQISEYLTREVGDSLQKKQDLKDILKIRPYYFIFALDKKIFDSMEILKEIIQLEYNCGFSILTVFDDLPKECARIFELHENGIHSVVHLNNPEKEDDNFCLDAMNYSVAMKAMRKISNINLKMLSQAYSLPKMLSFLEMYGVGRIEHLNAIKRWRENDPVKSLAVPIGVDTNGAMFTLDLHEKYQGPHGLVAGTTGSGKSEFIITYILSMAINFHPDEVAFILIDYKGGGLAGAFEDETRGIHLPHLVGTITNLDGAAIQRSLMSIQSELKRRQRIFNEAKSLSNEGTMDIYTYQKLYRNKQVFEPIPHLFIISDEFAELKAQEPEFMEQLISAARIGRSLGVHLILATQKPAGVVNDQIWSNTKFRVCLKVQDRGDSFEMLKRPEAADLKNTGRFYLQVGNNEFFALGQSAWCGASYCPQDEVIVQKDDEILFVDYVGQVVAKNRPVKANRDTNTKQIVGIVKYLSELAERQSLQPRKLWKEPLPCLIGVNGVEQQVVTNESSTIQIPLGMVDDPFRQAQYPLVINLQEVSNLLIVGGSGSGKTSALQTILYILSKNYSPENINYYILDYSSRNLNMFRKLPHCGSVMFDEHEGEIEKLIELFEKNISIRKKLFSDAEVSSYDAYIEIEKLPLLFLFIDNLAAFNEFKKGRDYLEKITSIMKNGPSYGMKVIATISNQNDCLYSMQHEFDKRLALQAADSYAYSNILNVRCSYAPMSTAGRGMCVVDGEGLECHIALVSDSKNEKQRSEILRERLQEASKRYVNYPRAKQIETAKANESFHEFCESFEQNRIPLGYNLDGGGAVAIPFQQLKSIYLYIGNMNGAYLPLENLLMAAQHNQMKIIIVRRLKNSVFEDKSFCERIKHFEQLAFYDCSDDSIEQLHEFLIKMVVERTAIRKRFCAENGIGSEIEQWTQPEAIRQWRKAVRMHTEPVFVLFESLLDFEMNLSEEMIGRYQTIFSCIKGYNIYFCGTSYAEDRIRLENALKLEDDGEIGVERSIEQIIESESPEETRIRVLRKATNMVKKSFNEDNFTLLFGGQFDKQDIVFLPYEFSSITSSCKASDYNRFLMNYRNTVVRMQMPIEQNRDIEEDMDEASIV